VHAGSGAVTLDSRLTSPDDDLRVSDTDFRFVERQIRLHVDLATWHPNPHAFDAKPDNWRRAFDIARVMRDGPTDSAEIAQRLGIEESLVEEDRVLLPYLDRTVAGLLSVLGWYVDTNF
jgi:hypothetical protein